MRGKSLSPVLRVVLVSTILILSLACNDDSESGITADFVAEPRELGAKQVYVQRDFVDGDELAVSIRVRAVDGIASADLTLEYDASRILFLASSIGTLFEQAGGGVDYSVNEAVAGELRIQIAPTAPGVTVDASTEAPRLVQLGFRVIRTGAAAAIFDSTSALDDTHGVAIPGVTFFEGTFMGS